LVKGGPDMITMFGESLQTGNFQFNDITPFLLVGAAATFGPAALYAGARYLSNAHIKFDQARAYGLGKELKNAITDVRDDVLNLF